MGGVYTITSPSGNFYIGSARDFTIRRRRHFNELRKGTHGNQLLQRAFEKHGEDGLRFSPILICADSNLLMYEQIALNAMRPSYNICQIAGSHLGTKRTAESRERMRLSKLGKKCLPCSEERRVKISLANKNMIFSEEHRAKLSAAATGRKHTAESRAKMSAAKRGRRPHNSGKKFNKEEGVYQ